MSTCAQDAKSKKLYKIAIKKANQTKYTEAIGNLDLAIKIDSTYAEAYYLRAKLSVELGKNLDEICNDLSKAAQYGHSESKIAYEQYCKVIPEDEFNSLLQEFNTYIEKYPNRMEGYYDRANLYFDSRQYKKAIEDYNRVIEISQYPVAYYNRGICYINLNERSKGCQDILKAKELEYNVSNEVIKGCKEILNSN